MENVSNNTEQTLIENVNKSLDYLAISKGEFSNKLGWSPSKYSKTFGQKQSRTITFSDACEVAAFLGFGIDDLLKQDFDPATTTPDSKRLGKKNTKRLSHCLDDVITFRKDAKKLEKTFHDDFPKTIRMVLNLYTEEYKVEGHLNRVRNNIIRAGNQSDRVIVTLKPYVCLSYDGLGSATNDRLILGYWFDEGNRYMALSICYVPDKDKYSNYGIRKRAYYKGMLPSGITCDTDVTMLPFAENLVAGEIFTRLYDFEQDDLSNETLNKDLIEAFGIYKSLLIKSSNVENEVFWKAFDAVVNEGDSESEKIDEAITEKLTVTLRRERRLPLLRQEVIEKAGFKCEVCGRSETFETANGTQYFEVSHFIPLSNCLPEWNPDAKSNLICVCPQCNRLLGCANTGIREEKIVELYYKRKEDLKKDGIDISLSDALKMNGL